MNKPCPNFIFKFCSELTLDSYRSSHSYTLLFTYISLDLAKQQFIPLKKKLLLFTSAFEFISNQSDYTLSCHNILVIKSLGLNTHIVCGFY